MLPHLKIKIHPTGSESVFSVNGLHLITVAVMIRHLTDVSQILGERFLNSVKMHFLADENTTNLE